MKAVDEALVNRVERSELLRALKAHEYAASGLRSKLGLVSREKFVDVPPDEIKADGLTRMRTDQIDRLFEAGRINHDQRSAALKFRTIWEAMGRGLYPGPTGGIVGTKSKGTFRHPLERMSPREFYIWVREYKPWANGPGAKTAIDRPSHSFKKSYLAVAYAVIVDNFGPHQLEQIWPISRGNGVVVQALQIGLGKWNHVEYDGAVDLEDVREHMLAAARTKIEETRPTRKAS